MDNIIALDFVGNPIEIGDDVILFQLHYRNFVRGKITKITKHYVFIDVPYSFATLSKNKIRNIKQYHTQVIVEKFINKQ